MRLEDYFSTWPFSEVPDRDKPIVWAGRPELLNDLRVLLQAFVVRPQSTLDLVWAEFGAGKTHLLFFLEQQAAKQDGLLPWYCVIPQGARSFSEVYRNLMRSFPFERAVPKLATGIQHALPSTEISPIMRALLVGTDEQRQIARDWLLGLRVDLRTARKLVQIPYKLDSVDYMQRALTEFLHFVVRSGSRVLLLLDEYQRVQGHRGGTREILNAVALDAFNSNATGLSIMFSCSATQQASAQRILAPELLDRMRGRKIVSLATFEREEAEFFVRDLCSAYRPQDYDGCPYAPFSEASLESGLDRLANGTNGSLLPRRIIQMLDNALSNAIVTNAASVTEPMINEAADTVVQSMDELPA